MTNDASAGREPDRFHQLMMGALDDELSPAGREEFQRLLAASPERQAEWNEHKKLKELTMKIKFTDPPEEVWERYWVATYNRIERRLAWVLVSTGAMILLVYGGYLALGEFLADPKVPAVIKGAVIVLLVGGAVLIVSVLREKIFTRKSDKYKEVQR